MIKRFDIEVLPSEINDEVVLLQKVADISGLSKDEINQLKIVKKSIDARFAKVVYRLQCDVYVGEMPVPSTFSGFVYRDVFKSKEVIIVGSGPAGLFAALRLIELGIKPIILERGKDVQSRRRDLAAINKHNIVNPESNYCFGEGGAGTYSDGKLYTRSNKRGDIRKILNILVAHGASQDILIEAHPHIGTNKLPKLITAIRNTIIQAGGEVRFNSKVTDLLIEGDAIKGVEINSEDKRMAEAVILATGHSARDIFVLLNNRKVNIEAKPFALGVRIEHPQSLIDAVQYHCIERGPYLPPASYSLATNIEKRGVFSFCMCPGGFIVPAATSQEEIVVNGMSPSKRDSRFANSGIVVSVELDDLKQFNKFEALSAMQFQASVEKSAWIAGGRTQSAPAQRLVDFITNRTSQNLPETSYQPGLTPADMRSVLPTWIHSRLVGGLKEFGKKIPRYITNDAVVVGVESRTSSPVRIPRDPLTLQHTQIQKLYPCGEGAGFAGGIISAAMDGERCAVACVELINSGNS